MSTEPVVCSIQRRHIAQAFDAIPNLPEFHPDRHRAGARAFRAMLANVPESSKDFIDELRGQVAQHEQLADWTRWTGGAS